MSKGEHNTTKKRRFERDPVTMRLNNRIDDLFYEMVAHMFAKCGDGFTQLVEKPVEESVRQLQAALQNQESEIKTKVQPLIRAVTKEAMALGMGPLQVRKAIDQRMGKNIHALNTRRLQDAVKRLSETV